MESAVERSQYARKRLITAEVGLTRIVRDQHGTTSARSPILLRKQSSQQQCNDAKQSSIRRVMHAARSDGRNDGFIPLMRKLQEEKARRRVKLQQESAQRDRQLSAQEEAQRLLAAQQATKRRELVLSTLAARRATLEKRKSERLIIKQETDRQLAIVKEKQYIHERLETTFLLQENSIAQARDEAIAQRKRQKKSAIDSKELWRRMREMDQRAIERSESLISSSQSRKDLFRRWREELSVLGPSKAWERVEQEEKRGREESLKRAKSVRSFYDRKVRYGLLVRELFPPKVDRRPPSPKFPTPKPTVIYPKIVQRRSKPALTPPPRLAASASRSSTPPPDYLTAMRQDRESSFSSNPSCHYRPRLSSIWSDPSLSSQQRIRRLRSEVHKADALAHRHESLLGRMDRRWSLGAEGRQVAADLYVRAIRAKLEMLEKM